MEDKNYDIRDILKEAKENKEPDDKERVLKNTEYNILKNIDLKKEIEKSDLREEQDDGDLKDLIETITNTSMLNKLGDDELASDLLSDLKADDTMIGEIKDVRSLIEANEKETKAPEVKKVDTKESTYDRSFFTSSLKLSKFDFEGNDRKRNIIATIIIIALILTIIVSGAILIFRAF